MKAIILNSNKALVIETNNIKENNNLLEINYNDPKISLVVPINNVICVNADDDVAKIIATSLVGENGEITFYNPKERTLRTNKVGETSVKALNKKLK